MRLREYQAKTILARYGLAIPKGQVICSVDEVAAVMEAVGGAVVLKAQVPVGGRGKAGGIRLANSLPEAEAAVRSLLGSQINGYTVAEVLVEERLEIQAEHYLAIITDSAAARPLVMVSTRGGIDIEEVARQEPQAVVRLIPDPLYGLGNHQALYLTKKAGFAQPLAGLAADWLKTLYRVFWESDATLVEVNPLIVTSQGGLVAADARLIIDDNALFRQPSMSPWRDLTADEAMAEAAHINYLALDDGDIGIIGSGAGMAMANMDQVAYFGGRPANFMDVGPGINDGGGRAAMEILLGRTNLTAILISGYSGARLEILARDIVAALASHTEVRLPIVVRLQGMGDREALEILRQCPYPNLHLTPEFDEAARLAVQLSTKK